MTGIARKSLDQAGGIQLAGQQNWFYVDAQPVVLKGDPVEPHGSGIHSAPVMAEGSDYWSIDGIPVSRAGHLATCGHPTTGSDWFLINGGTE